MSLYLYGFAPAGQEPPPETLRGVAGAEVEIESLGPVVAVVSTVPDDEFDAPEVEVRMHDPAWLGQQGARHERVVTWFVDHGEILPARLLTLFTGVGALREAMSPRAGELARRIGELAGLREWDLKVTWDREVLGGRLGEVSDEVAAMDREIASANPGRRYLLERKRDKVVRDEATRAAKRLALELFRKLEGHARATRILPPPRATGVETAGPVALNGALLLDGAGAEQARTTLGGERPRLEALGLAVELTGPWAPYRFLEDDTPDDATEPTA